MRSFSCRRLWRWNVENDYSFEVSITVSQLISYSLSFVTHRVTLFHGHSLLARFNRYYLTFELEQALFRLSCLSWSYNSVWWNLRSCRYMRHWKSASQLECRSYLSSFGSMFGLFARFRTIFCHWLLLCILRTTSSYRQICFVWSSTFCLRYALVRVFALALSLIRKTTQHFASFLEFVLIILLRWKGFDCSRAFAVTKARDIFSYLYCHAPAGLASMKRSMNFLFWKHARLSSAIFWEYVRLSVVNRCVYCPV